MNIIINGETKELPGSVKLNELLAHFELPSERVAVELNREVIRKKNWTEIEINEGDKLEIIHFVGGG